MHHFFEQIFGLHRLFFQCVHQQLGTDHVHPRQGPILGMLLHHDGISQAEIVRMMNVSAATVAVSTARLERLGYVTRVRNQHNQRANVLALTEQGQKEAVRLERMMDEVSQAALNGFSGEETDEVAGYVRRMIQNLQTEYGIKECKDKHATHD